MKRALILAAFAACLANTPSWASGPPELSPQLQKLDVSAGHWIYHGRTLHAPSGNSGSWIWDEYCRWSENQAFMACSFTNNWSGRVVKSLVVDTWSDKDKSYRHYELFNNGGQPFVSRMIISGNTRVEYATQVEHGEKVRTRITYVFDSPTHVRVKIEGSRNGGPWVTTNEGEGVKQL